MRAFYSTKHKINLTNILIDIYKDPFLGPILGFKGGTAAMLFHNLPRFSLDLDFDLIPKYKKGSKEYTNLVNKITKLLLKRYLIKDRTTKYNTLFWLASYGSGLSQIKIEISTRNIPFNHYELKFLYGVGIKTLKIQDMIAHKLVAVMSRPSLANRDLFDIHYFLNTHYAGEINNRIIKHRTGKYPYEFYSQLLDFIKNRVNTKGILSGLGEVLEQRQKDWAKAKLIPELVGLIERQRDLFPQSVKFKKLKKDNPKRRDYTLYDFLFAINSQNEISFPLKISRTLKATKGYIEEDIKTVFENKITNFLLLNPLDHYQVRPITTYDLKSKKSLDKIELEDLVL